VRVRLAIAAAALCTLACLSAPAQKSMDNTPHTGYVYPAGGQAGTTFEVLVGGQYLNGTSAALFSGSGIKSSVVEYIKPPGKGAAGQLRDKMKDLMDKPGAPKSWSPTDVKAMQDLKLQMARFITRAENEALEETVRLKISIAANTPPGEYELRLKTTDGVTAPLNFFVGTMPEWTKTAADILPANFDLSDMGNLKKLQQIAADRTPPPVVDVVTPVVVNGQVKPAGVDRYRFTAHKGEHLVVAAAARELVPYIADAVPGWFQASLTLYDATGREVAYADHYDFHPDPAMLFEIPADGQYTLAIHDSIYRGREDFVYRVAIGKIPYVTASFPLGGRAGSKTEVHLTGWNLPQSTLKVDTHKKDSGVRLLSVGESEYTARPFALDTLPEEAAKDGNHSREHAQKIALGSVVNGRVMQPGEQEYFAFNGKAGQMVEAEVFAHRLDSPLDSTLTLMDARGKALAVNDDYRDEGDGLLTSQTDSLVQVKLPENGVYYIKLGDSESHGGSEFAYRLRVRGAEPEFEVRISPSSVNSHAGSVVPVMANVIRHGGFNGDVAVNLTSGHGFELSGGVIPAGQTHVPMTLTIPANASDVSHLALECSAVINGKTVKHPTLPADDWEQAFFYHHLVPAGEMMADVTPSRMPAVRWTESNTNALGLVAGRMVTLKLNVPMLMAADAKFQLEGAPEGITIEKTATEGGDYVLYLKADGTKAKAGLRGNLLLVANISHTTQKTDKKNKPFTVTITQYLPAMPFEVRAAPPPGAQTTAQLQPHSN